ncbi:hypothetical protein GC387_12450 [Pseudomonas sp. MWU12-2323]|nr:hypothetical protein [Pseudomonas sp. MWU12-2323]
MSHLDPCRSRLAGDSLRKIDARLAGLIAGKPAPTDFVLQFEKVPVLTNGCRSRGEKIFLSFPLLYPAQAF